MGTARHFDGIGDQLQVPGSSETFTNFSFAAWVKRDAAGATRNALIGRLFAVDHGWAIFIDESNVLNFKRDAVLNQIASPDLSEWAYLGVSYASAGGAGNVKFYYGPSQEAITLIGTATDSGGFLELGTAGRMIGSIQNGNLISVVSWNGFLDKIGLWRKQLTLEEFKQFAPCGAEVVSDNLIHAEIIGDDPEPYSAFGSPAGDLTVVGTTILTGTPVGCDFAIVTALIEAEPTDAIASTVAPSVVLGSTTPTLTPADVIASALMGLVKVEAPPPPPPPPPPIPSDFVPRECPPNHLGGTILTVTGTNFVSGQTEVFFNRPAEAGLIRGQQLNGWEWDGGGWQPIGGGPASAVVVFVSSTEIRVTVPDWVVPATLTIRTPGGSGVTTQVFSCGVPLTLPSWEKGYYRSGDAGAVCDRCGFRYWLSELQKEWTGLRVCQKCFENRHPQDFVQAVPDGKAIRDSRREQEPVFVSPGDIRPEDL